MKQFSLVMVVMLASGLGPLSMRAAEGIYNIRDDGAVPDGKTLCTAAIQKAIDRCAAGGGGTVYFPPGDWLSGTLVLRSHVTLELETGCRLLGSTQPADYPPRPTQFRSYSNTYVEQSLISGEDLDQVAIRGRGTIDGQGTKFPPPARWPEFKTRPFAIRLVNCRDVLVEGVTLRDSVMWMQQYLACERVRIHGIAVINFACHCSDGLDIDGCRDVVVSDSKFEADDDALCLKSTSLRPCENVTISNCLVSSHCNGIKMGTETLGGFRNITITNCAVSSPPASAPLLHGVARGLAGVALEIVDGGTLENVTISNLAIDGVTTPLFLRLGNRARPIDGAMPKPGVGIFRNVTVSNVVATRVSEVACSITGIPGHPIENVLLSNIQITTDGGGTLEEAAANVPEKESNYPECIMFGMNLPAYGFYGRHVAGLKLRDVRLRTERTDLRPAIVCDDVKNLVIDGLDASPAAGPAAEIRLTDCPSAVVRNSGDIFENAHQSN